MYDELVAELYDLEHDSVTEDIDLYLSYAARTGGPVLDLGCGTGRVMLPLVKHGYEVVGLDASPHMLDRARRRLSGLPEARFKLIHGVMQDSLYNLPEETFGLAICALNTWSHVHDLQQAMEILEGIKKALRPSGLLILDMEDVAGRRPGNGEVLLAGKFRRGEDIILKLVSAKTDQANSIDHVTIIWDISSSDTLKRVVFEAEMRNYTLGEIYLLFKAAGLKIENVFGSWDMTPYYGQGDRLIVVGAKGNI
ncbi:Methyltransferase type 11 [Thermobaculum terrenum ATCC BAA-798]|uniref:Methyltransferase type 11 n=1 Tax=Thermobaculum terrenum (strain ATCC BAA-798 / CCMEE 7001 / YNP1) TaxID=525904 RepID=D1CBX1_THET1|nr:class I SAM-dependent methyltransferase [Thermobaculum terrenum]ACZ42286.1 Methyltransferase type 11 [Thermobaculum terrenum ATCC BAA-798]